jgi:hypothetical protein
MMVERAERFRIAAMARVAAISALSIIRAVMGSGVE